MFTRVLLILNLKTKKKVDAIRSSFVLAIVVRTWRILKSIFAIFCFITSKKRRKQDVKSNFQRNGFSLAYTEAREKPFLWKLLSTSIKLKSKVPFAMSRISQIHLQPREYNLYHQNVKFKILTFLILRGNT